MTATALSATHKPAGVIETHHADAATEWGYSFTSHNPEPDDYIRCASEADAWKLDRHIRRIESALASAEPVAWYTEDHLTDKSATTWDKETAKRWTAKGWPVWSLYAHAQPAAKVEAPDLLDDLARVYATIPTLPVTADNAEQATAALLAFCYLPSLRSALDAQYLPPNPQGDAEDYLRPLRNAIDTADAYATGGPRNLRIVTLRMDAAEAMLARAGLAANSEHEPKNDIYDAYKTWPGDIKQKLSFHDLRRMQGWSLKADVDGWRIDTSAGGPILVYKDCSVIEGEDARYVIGLIRKDQQASPTPASVPDAVLEVSRRLIREAIPATASGQTCFVPKYVIAQLADAIGFFTTPEPTP